MMEMIFPGKGMYLNAVNFIAEYLLVIFFFHDLGDHSSKARARAGYVLLAALALLYFSPATLPRVCRQTPTVSATRSSG